MVCKLGSSPMDCKSVKEVLTGLVHSCDHSGQGNGTLASLCILGFVWWIWHKRNETLLFNGKIRSWNLLLRSILTQVRMNAMFLAFNSPRMLTLLGTLPRTGILLLHQSLLPMPLQRFESFWFSLMVIAHLAFFEALIINSGGNPALPVLTSSQQPPILLV